MTTGDQQARRGSGWEAMHAALAADAAKETLLHGAEDRRLTLASIRCRADRAWQQSCSSPAAWSKPSDQRPARNGEAWVREVREVTTADLQVGDVVHWRGRPYVVAEAGDTGAPAAFGTGTAYDLTLVDPAGGQTAMLAAASQRWTRV